MPHEPPPILTPYIEALGRAGVRAEVLSAERAGAPGAVRPDAWLWLWGPQGPVAWPCELTRRIERKSAGPVIHRMLRLRGEEGRALLLTDHVSPSLGEELRSHGVAFVDASGNAYLEDDGLYVWVSNQPPKKVSGARPRGLYAAGLKLLFVLLKRRAHDASQRELAAAAGIALGGVPRTLEQLERRGWIDRHDEGIALRDTEAMLRRWDEGYADTLRPKLVLAVCRRRGGHGLERLAEQVDACRARGKLLVGGELGAALLTKHLRPTSATLHVDSMHPTEVMEELDLLPDPSGDTTLLRTFGAENAFAPKHLPGPQLADPLLLRADLLLRPDDRLDEIAQRIRIEHVEPRWR